MSFLLLRATCLGWFPCDFATNRHEPSSRLRENPVSTQDAQKGQTSHPPNPGAPRRAFPQARPQRAKRRGGTYRTLCRPFARRMDLGERKIPSSASGLRKTFFNVEPLSDARTTLADFFSILLKHEFDADGPQMDIGIIGPVRRWGSNSRQPCAIHKTIPERPYPVQSLSARAQTLLRKVPVPETGPGPCTRIRLPWKACWK